MEIIQCVCVCVCVMLHARREIDHRYLRHCVIGAGRTCDGRLYGLQVHSFNIWHVLYQYL